MSENSTISSSEYDSTESVPELDGAGIEEEVEEAPQPLATTFAELLPESPILNTLTKLGFTAPTQVQARAVPVALRGGDLVVQSRTGSGKTLAYALPLVASVLGNPAEENVTQALVIVPTRELANQVCDVITAVAENHIKPVLIIGGSDFSTQEKNLSRDARVVIGTPGRLLDLIRQRKLRLTQCRFFVLDEADETLSLGFLEDVRTILSRLPDKRQGIFTSATITPRVDMLASAFLDHHQVIAVDDTYNDLPSITHYYCDIGGELTAKPRALCDLIETLRPVSSIIFCNTKSDTQLVEVLLRRRGFDARRLNSDLTQAQRNRVMKKIRNRELQFLVATDVAARGIDIEQIDTVINYTIHEQPELYLHRTGRTGRAGRSGRAISLVGPRDFSSFHFLKKVVNVEFQKLPLPSDEEICEARLAHLHELVRQSQIELSPRDILIGQKLLKELGGEQAYPEELQEFIAKLACHMVEHHVKLEAKSLEEELEGGRPVAARAEGDQSEGTEYERRPPRGRNDDRRGGRGEDRQGRGDDRRGGRGEDRQGRGDDRRGRGNQERGGNDRGPRRDNFEDRAPRGEGNQPQGPRQQLADDVRLFIGRGSAQGMTENDFYDLAAENASLAPDDIRYFVLRDSYGFFDVSNESAPGVLQRLNGVLFQGEPLQIEVATTIRREPPPHRRNNDRGHQRNNGRNRNRDRGGRSGGGRRY